MRILMLTQLYPPHIGGIEQHVCNLSAGLVARGHNVTVVTLWHEGLPEFELDQGVKVYRIRGSVHRAAQLLFTYGRIYAPPFPDPELTFALRRIVAHEHPQIVHAHNWLVHSFLPLRGWSKARLVVTLHDYGLICAKWTLVYHHVTCSGPGFRKCLSCAADNYGRLKGVSTVLSNWVMGIAERAAVDLFLPVSRAVAVGGGLVGSGVPFQVIPNFLPDDVSEIAGIPHGDTDRYVAQLPSEDYLLFVGALGPHKGLDVLLQAYADLVDPPPLVLIGYEHSGYRITRADFQGKVIVLKNLPHTAVMEAWRRSIMALVPSVMPDPCPTVAMEAMITGRPVIASRIGGLPDLVTDNVTGLLVSPSDPVALRQAIERLLADSELRARMGQAGKQKVIEFQASTVLSRIERVYSRLIKQRHRE